MKQRLSAMIFAAGKGTRLVPWTHHHPKALVEVDGVPMLRRVIEKLKDAGVCRMLVNTHHFAEQIEAFLSANNNFGVDINISHEVELLDTGGGVCRALDLYGIDGPLIVHNADILTDFPIDEMVAAHRSTGADAQLLVWMRQTKRYLYFDSSDRMHGWYNPLTGELRGPVVYLPSTAGLVMRAFGGVHLLSERGQQEIAAYGNGRGSFSIIDFYIDNCDRLDLRAFTPSEPFRWHDVGTPEKLHAAQVDFMKQQLPDKITDDRKNSNT